MKWTQEKLVAVGHNAVAVYETFYNGEDKEKVVEVFDVKRQAKLTAEVMRSHKPFKSVKMMCTFID